jgi:hypothetical protein
MFSTNINETDDKLFTGVDDTRENLLLVSNKPAMKLCHGFSVIVSVVDIGDKFITDVIVHGEQSSTGDKKKTLAINLSPVTMTLVKYYLRGQ